jgi:hypothetical protein
MIKDFVPAKTNLKSGIVIKQHLLNRSKHDTPRVYVDSSSYVGTVSPSGQVIGGTGGVFNDYNSFTPRIANSQSWYEQIPTPLGYTSSYHKDQAEFYNGELPYFPLIVTNGESNVGNSVKLYPTILPFSVQGFAGSSGSFINGGNPGSNLIAIWYDSEGSAFNAINTLLPPGAKPSSGTKSSPIASPTTTISAPLPITTDKDGSSGGNSGGVTGKGGTGKTTVKSTTK